MAQDDRNGLAEKRADFAEDRTVLAHERSFTGWVRTGMASGGHCTWFQRFVSVVGTGLGA